jgi:hypothetical protein
VRLESRSVRIGFQYHLNIYAKIDQACDLAVANGFQISKDDEGDALESMARDRSMIIGYWPSVVSQPRNAPSLEQLSYFAPELLLESAGGGYTGNFS